MLLAYLIFLIISLILVFVLNICKESINVKGDRHSSLRIIGNIVIYLVIVVFLARFYSFNPIENDVVLGIKVNPYVAVVSLVLQFLNIVTLADTWYKITIERLNNKVTVLVLNFLYFMVIMLGNIILYMGYHGTDSVNIYSSVKIVERLNLIMLFIPFVIYDLNIINLIKIFIRRRRQIK